MEYIKFIKKNPITKHDLVIAKSNISKYTKSELCDFAISTYYDLIEQLYSTCNQNIIIEIGKKLNDEGGFQLMSIVLNMILCIIESKSDDMNVISHIRYIEMCWSGIGDWLC